MTEQSTSSRAFILRSADNKAFTTSQQREGEPEEVVFGPHTKEEALRFIALCAEGNGEFEPPKMRVVVEISVQVQAEHWRDCAEVAKEMGCQRRHFVKPG